MGNPKKKVEIPEGDVRLPAAENMFESTTIYFGKNPAVSLVCDSRAEAELLAAIARDGCTAAPFPFPPRRKDAASFTNASRPPHPRPGPL